jgi:hypothetical protein
VDGRGWTGQGKVEDMNRGTVDKPKLNLFQNCAQASWVGSVLVSVMLSSNKSGSKTILDIIVIILVLMGTIGGVVALCGISKHGIKKILIPALVGLLMNGFLLFIWITNFLKAFTHVRHGG